MRMRTFSGDFCRICEIWSDVKFELWLKSSAKLCSPDMWFSSLHFKWNRQSNSSLWRFQMPNPAWSSERWRICHSRSFLGEWQNKYWFPYYQHWKAHPGWSCLCPHYSWRWGAAGNSLPQSTSLLLALSFLCVSWWSEVVCSAQTEAHIHQAESYTQSHIHIPSGSTSYICLCIIYLLGSLVGNRHICL